MARSRAQKKSESETKAAGAEGGQNVGGISKAQAVRNALAEGLDDLGDIEGFLKSQYGIDMPRQMISAYKSQARAKEAGKQATGKGRAADGSSNHGVRASASENELLNALEAMKPLVEKLGADKVHRLIDLLK